MMLGLTNIKFVTDVSVQTFGHTFNGLVLFLLLDTCMWDRNLKKNYALPCVTSQKSGVFKKTNNSYLLGGEYFMNCNLYYLFHEPIFRSTVALQYFNCDF